MQINQPLKSTVDSAEEKVPRIKTKVKLKHGRASEIARRHGVSETTVRLAARGEREANPDILADIRRTARRDATKEAQAA